MAHQNYPGDKLACQNTPPDHTQLTPKDNSLGDVQWSSLLFIIIMVGLIFFGVQKCADSYAEKMAAHHGYSYQNN